MIPAGPEEIPGRIDGAQVLDEGEVRLRARGTEGPAAGELVALAVAGLAARGRAWRAAGRVLVVPVDDHGVGVAAIDAAVVRGHEVHLVVGRGVVDQRARAVVRAAEGDRTDRAHVVAPGIGAVEAGDVHLAGARLGSARLGEVGVALVDAGDAELDLAAPRAWQGQLHHQVVGGDERRPELALGTVVERGERPDDLGEVGRVEQQLRALRQVEGPEREIDRGRLRRLDAQPPEKSSVAEILPGAALGRRDRDRVRDREAVRPILLGPPGVLGGDRHQIECRQADRVDRFEVDARELDRGRDDGEERRGAERHEEDRREEQGTTHASLRGERGTANRATKLWRENTTAPSVAPGERKYGQARISRISAAWKKGACPYFPIRR